METIIAIFDTPDEVIAATRLLQQAGISRAAITVMSSEPVHLAAEWHADAPRETKSRIGLFAIAGGLIGGALAVLLTFWTSERVNLNTGGMPIIAPWAFGIIIFEMTALGAVLMTVGRMIVEARLFRRGALRDYDEGIAEGRIALAIECADAARAEAVRHALGDRLKPRPRHADS